MKMKDVIRRAMMARLPSCQEWNTLMDVVGKSRDAAHWAGAFSWGQDADPCFPPNRVILGCYTPRYFSSRNTSYQHKVLGFRPVFDAMDHTVPDGAVVRIGTLYMDDQPVKIPERPSWDGDIVDYIPGAKLEMREALDDPDYQVQAIKAGDVLIADRVLIRNVSWADLEAMGFANG